MPTDKFVASLHVVRGRIATTLAPFELEVHKATGRNADITPLPYCGPDDPAPGAANVWLQIWEIDTFESGSSHRSHPAGEPADENDFLVEIPGFLKQVGSGHGAKLELRVLAAPTFGSGDPLGHFTLKLKKPDGTPWQSDDGKDPVIPILGEGEDEVDLGCVLADAAGKREQQSKWKGGTLCHAINMTHILGSMEHEGGLTCAFHVVLNTEDQVNALHEFQRSLRGKSKAEKKEAMANAPPAPRGGTSPEHPKALYSDHKGVNNDEVFPHQGERFARAYHSAGLKDGELVNVSTPYSSGFGEIVSKIATIRQKTMEGLLKPSLAETPKVRRLVICTHGDRRHGLLCGPPTNWLSVGEIPAAIRPLGEHLANDVVVTLFACLTGRAPDGDVAFGGDPGAGRAVGQDSFAWHFWKNLRDVCGLAEAAVWAHTTAGHATANANLRAFGASGSSDIIWMKERPGDREKQARDFVEKNTPDDSDDITAPIVHAAVCHPGGVLARVCVDGAGGTPNSAMA